ncbi:unnamed protein product [Microthlaspi erraticum]|uniref:Zinc finger PHD-type domain-containing protein n=1 Tax=Microthlaspi erraticum TaxID=1685480 RepID=A0A6D2I5W6_9BRAS|nr:unnamed protein product [Microthlaspi erraticum]
MKPHEEWVDGSWTVDCVCGVNFDDGKEMVNCDECGVWVHTWCSRYVKGDDLFVCHKCKTIKNNNDDKAKSLLVTSESMRMEDLSNQSREISLNRGFRACKEIPIEERVHVQGVPGGDLALFESFSSVFSRQLWKCSGYVPKKFEFQFREFPCWDDHKEDVCEIEDQDCGGVLLSASHTNEEKLGLDENRDLGCRETETEDSQIDINREKSLIYPLSTNKRRKEDCESCVKKKVRVVDKEEEDSYNNAIGRL